jgi:hypothetical protein
MKKITSLILSVALALSLMPYVLVSAASDVKTETYTMTGIADFAEKSLTSAETNVLENNGAVWYGKLLSGSGVNFKNDTYTGSNEVKFHSWAQSQATLSALFDTGDRVVSGVTAGSGGLFLANGIPMPNTGAELRYLVSEDLSTYFGFGAENISLDGSYGVNIYYTISGNKTYIGNNLSGREPNVSFTVSDTTVSYSIVAGAQTLTGSFEVADMAAIAEQHKYPVQIYTNLIYDTQLVARSVSVTYTTIKPNVIKDSYTLGNHANGNKTFGNNNVIIEDGDNAVWYGKKLSGDTILFEKTGWEAANEFRVVTWWGASGVISCVPNTNGRVINSLTGGSAIINPDKSNSKGSAELRYLASTDMKKYFGFGIDVANSKLYYTLNGTKTDITDSSVTWPTSSGTKITFTVSGSTVTCNFTAGGQTASTSFAVDNMKALIDGCEYPMQFYVNRPSDDGKYIKLQGPSISYTTIAGPNFVDDFSSYNSSNIPAYGESNAVGATGYNPGNLIAGGEKGTWTLSDLVSGTIDSGDRAWEKDQKSYIKNSGEYAGSLYLDASANVCGVDLNLTDRIYDVDKIELMFTGSRSHNSAVRFMVNDYGKTAYELGVKKNGKPFVRKLEGMYAGKFRYFGSGVVEGSEYAGTDDIVGWDDYAGHENQGMRRLKLTVTFNDAGFDYKLENLSLTKEIFQGTYIDPTGKCIKPNYDKNPVLQVVNAGGRPSAIDSEGNVKEYVGTIVDDVKIWYETKAVKTAAKTENGSADITFSPADFDSNGSITVVVAWYDASGNAIGVSTAKVEDQDQASETVNVTPAAKAASGTVWFWNGDVSDVNPFSNETLDFDL